MTTTVKSQIKSYQKVKGVTDYRLEKMADEKPGWWKATKNPSNDKIKRIFSILPELSAEWVFRNRGGMVRCVNGVKPMSERDEAYYRSLLEIKAKRIEYLRKEIAKAKKILENKKNSQIQPDNNP